MTKSEQSKRAAARDELRETFKPGDTVYTVLRHVSRSGMSRSISVHAHPGEDDWSYLVSRALGYRIDHDRGGLKVSGCGMDMGFHIVYELSHALYLDGFGCIGERCPSNDHSNGDRDYTRHTLTNGTGQVHWHTSGGYALRHRWV